MEIAYGMSLDVLCSSDNEQGDKANRVYASSRPISLQSVILMVKKKRKRKKKITSEREFDSALERKSFRNIRVCRHALDTLPH